MIKNYIINPINSFLNSGHARSIRAKKTIVSSILFRGLSIATTLLLVPLCIGYLNTERYGVWITISSIIAWLAYFDIGLGNGMRNKFAEAVAKKEYELARTYVSTTYALIAVIFGFIFILFFAINPVLNWVKILNAPENMSVELSRLALIVVTFFCLQIIFQLINVVLTANQEAEKTAFLGFLNNFLAMIIIYILTKTTSGSLLLAGLAISISPVIVYFITSIFLYKKKFKDYAPSIKYVKFKYSKDLMGLGIKFFVIQVSLLIMIQASNIIIAQLFGPEDVTKFNIAYRYFNVVIMLWWILVSPIWSAITEAWVTKDVDWIRDVMNKLRKYWMLLCLGAIAMLVLANFVFRLWVGSQIKVPFTISLSLALYVITYSYFILYSQFLNGVGKIQMQLYAGIWSIILYIPAAILLCKVFGVSGVIYANVLFNIINIIWATYQFKKIINGRASGLWNK
ncbi:MAG TPA: MATE family efflux transporter [Bacteroidales bacterium]|nr:MATE family efflux transporter [Bacteroidales bacterium]HPT20319.1 MATE family efflux transporter [Bacteroidales bacterium]